MDGPRAVQAHELDALRALTDIVFRQSMPEQYPQLFNLDNLDNLRVCFDGSTCTSHTGMTRRRALIMGCTIDVCCIGAVCTHPDYRKLGLASLCLDSAVNHAHDNGVDFMIVSGDRGLYTRNGCLKVGHDFIVELSNDTLKGLVPSPNITVSEIPLHVDLSSIASCYRMEPVRFVRPPDDYKYLKQSGWAMNSPVKIFAVMNQHGNVLGYFTVREFQQSEPISVVEFAGDRSAILTGMRQVLNIEGSPSIQMQIQGHDAVMMNLLNNLDARLSPTNASGTVKIINFEQLLKRMTPYFIELLGELRASKLRFEQSGNSYIFGYGSEEFTTDRDMATQTVFGSPNGLPQLISNIESDLGSMLRTIFPVPTLWYGINYC